jgi:hypothetical protein
MRNEDIHGDELQPSEDQIDTLLEFGVPEEEIAELGFEAAAELIAELQAIRLDAGRIRRE